MCGKKCFIRLNLFNIFNAFHQVELMKVDIWTKHRETDRRLLLNQWEEEYLKSYFILSRLVFIVNIPKKTVSSGSRVMYIGLIQVKVD
jgi:hypothetical protein